LHRQGRDPATFPFVLTSICHVAVDSVAAAQLIDIPTWD